MNYGFVFALFLCAQISVLCVWRGIHVPTNRTDHNNNSNNNGGTSRHITIPTQSTMRVERLYVDVCQFVVGGR